MQSPGPHYTPPESEPLVEPGHLSFKQTPSKVGEQSEGSVFSDHRLLWVSLLDVNPQGRQDRS